MFAEKFKNMSNKKLKSSKKEVICCIDKTNKFKDTYIIFLVIIDDGEKTIDCLTVFG